MATNAADCDMEMRNGREETDVTKPLTGSEKPDPTLTSDASNVTSAGSYEQDKHSDGDEKRELANAEEGGKNGNVQGGGDGKTDKEEEDTSGIPIDRGYAFVIVAATFGMHILVVGGVKSFGVLFVEVQDKYQVTARELGVAQGITMTLMMGLGFLANMLAARFTCQKVVFTGGLLSGIGFLLTAVIPSYNYIYVTYCLVTGVEKLGSSFGLTILGVAISMSVGPLICGAIRDETGSWNAAFIFGGVGALVGSVLPIFEPLAQKWERKRSS